MITLLVNAYLNALIVLLFGLAVLLIKLACQPATPVVRSLSD